MNHKQRKKHSHKQRAAYKKNRVPRYPACSACGQHKHDVKERDNLYQQDVFNETGATWIACDYCQEQSQWDI